LSVLSAATIALALLADATGFGAQTTTLALVLLPVVLLLGIAAHGRLVEINREEVELSLAMNRLRHGYLTIAPALEPYFTTGHHDDEQGLAASYLLAGRGGPRLWRWGQFLVNTPTIVATLDAALAAAIVVLVVRAAEAPRWSPWWRGQWRSWSFGRRCLCCSSGGGRGCEGAAPPSPWRILVRLAIPSVGCRFESCRGRQYSLHELQDRRRGPGGLSEPWTVAGG
jgi:hypothetical protein